jgi:MHS family alpha-ketoglutarate permease-like MFS transporter
VASASTLATTSRPRLRPLLAAAVGNIVEWFDFTIYATFAVYFAPLFFPSADPTASLLSTFAVFAVGFFVRPLGGWLIGAYADRRGRRKALLLTIVLMTAPAFVIGIAPTYASVGVLAPVVLVLARMLQGFAAGGEAGGAMAYLSEIAPEHRKGLYSSLWYTTVVLGMVVASMTGFVLTRLLAAEAMGEWGWRIPFLLGGVAGLLSLWVRRAMVETSDAVVDGTAASRRAGLGTLLLEYPRETLRVILLMAGSATAFYTFVSYMPTHLIKSVGLAPSTTFGVHTVALIVFMVLLPTFGAVSDRIGRRPLGFVFAIGGGIAIYPLSLALSDRWYVSLAVDLAFLALTACIFSVLAVIMTDLFPSRMRAMGVGAPYNLATAIFGGTAPFLLTWLAGQGRADSYFIYLAGLVLLSAVGLGLPNRISRTVRAATPETAY